MILEHALEPSAGPTGCTARVIVLLRSGSRHDCSSRLAGHTSLSTLDAEAILLDDVSLQSAGGCEDCPVEIEGSYAPGLDFVARFELAGALSDPGAPLACWEGDAERLEQTQDLLRRILLGLVLFGGVSQ